MQIIHPKTNLDAVQHALHKAGIAADGNALIEGVEVVVVKGQAHGQALDDEAGQLVAGAAPLLLGIALDELFVDICAHQRDGLFFQILRFGNACFPTLPLDLRSRFFRSDHAPHLVEGVHVEGQGVKFALVIRHRGIGEAVKGHKLIHIIPNRLIVGMEDVCPVLVKINALHLFRVDVARNVIALVDDKHGFSGGFGLLGEDRTVKARADDEIIVWHKNSPF